MVHAAIPSAWVVKGEGLEVQGHPQPHSKFEANLYDMSPRHLKHKINIEILLKTNRFLSSLLVP